MPKYKGNYKTQLRVRAQNGNIIYLSKEFEGEINYNQFFLSKKEPLFNNPIWNALDKDERKRQVDYYFFGSNPKF